MSFIHGKVGTLTIQGKPTPVYFNLNTCAYFDERGKHRLMAILMKVFRGFQGGEQNFEVTEFFEHVDFPILRLLAAAALHTYDKNDEPVHPFTPGQLGGYLGSDDWAKLLPMLQKGAMDFLAREQDLPKSILHKESGSEDPTPAPTPLNSDSGGGTESSDLDAAILNSLEES